MRYNAAEPQAAETYRELALIAGLVPHNAPAETAVAALAEHVGRLVEIAREATDVTFPRLSNGLLPTLAAEADRQWTARFNARPIGATDFEQLYTAALS